MSWKAKLGGLPVSTMAAALAYLLCALAACSSESNSTYVVVQVESDFASEFSTIKVDISNPVTMARSKQEVFGPASEGEEFLPLSFAVVPNANGDTNPFIVTVSGFDTEDNLLVRVSKLARFVRGARSQVTVALTKACRGITTCAWPAMTCTPSDDGIAPATCAPTVENTEDGQDAGGTTLSDQIDAGSLGDSGGSAEAGSAGFSDGGKLDDAAFVPGAIEGSYGGSESEVCDQEGQLRCTMSGTGLRKRCETGHWVDLQPCGEGLVCDPAAMESGGCRALLDVCRGNAGNPVCDGAIMQICDSTGGAERTETCGSERLCQQGLPLRKCSSCVPAEARCTGAKLEKCTEDGSAFALSETCSSEALCNATAGSCTTEACLPDDKTCAGDTLVACQADQTDFETEGELCAVGMCDDANDQCDVCVPGARTCANNSVKICSSDGQSYSQQACASPKSKCTGQGVCVECVTASDCLAPTNDCLTATCNAATGTCGTARKAAGTSCSGGTCDSAGTCVQPVCGDGKVNQASEQCDDGNQLSSDSCIDCVLGECGDGYVNHSGEVSKRETCEIGINGDDRWTCDETCHQRTLYNPAATSGDCVSGTVWFTGYCTKQCATVSDCPAAPAPLTAKCVAAGQPCLLYGCSSSADCPTGLVCSSSGGICGSCSSDDQCPAGQTCGRFAIGKCG